jgi:hypothetical protein
MIRDIGLIVLMTWRLSGQAFEVASVRLHDKPGGRVGISTSGQRLTAEAKTLKGLVAYAWDLKTYQRPTTPALLPFGDSFYDIAARAERDAPRPTPSSGRCSSCCWPIDSRCGFIARRANCRFTH